ncbi:GtrA family protein [Alsobacter sp. SYSU M60028]|uniref:GtrA family protein n=1 Tax=Alsobacter ponti TaxID=2962936 RepID=A0ABT1LE48_9HYPH|nr:GtrA family protein [Alsobacter ponti]
MNRAGAPRLLSRLARFVGVGGTGFLADAGVLSVLVAAGLDPLPARLASILFALTVTWQLNRRITFGLSGRGTSREFAHYLSLGAISSLVNYAVYAGVLASGLSASPLLALAAGSAVAMAVTFVGLDRIVFRAR